MPYIDEKRREFFNESINLICLSLNKKNNKLTNEEFLSLCGDINYCFSRIISNVMGDVSYSKIAIITGVLENIKQEFYRRVAEGYENKKIAENGDIPEYRKLS